LKETLSNHELAEERTIPEVEEEGVSDSNEKDKLIKRKR